VRKLHQRLSAEGWIDPWLDEEKLRLGQDWAVVIKEALDVADVVLVFLSRNSIQKEGFVQRELNHAWELSLEKPSDIIYLIPFRLDDCQVPRQLSSRHWGDYFGDEKENTYQNLLRSLKKRYQQKLKVEAKEYLYDNDLIRKATGEIENEQRRQANDQHISEEVEQLLEKYINEFIAQRVVASSDDNRPNIQETTTDFRTPKKKSVINTSKKRSLISYTIHIAILLFGWSLGYWKGILFLSLPLFLAYYFVLFRMAIGLVPASNPDDRTERWRRFVILASYTWGIQFPLIVVDGYAWKKPDIRIMGDYTQDYPISGLIWMRSHQVGVITGGTRLERVDGPGLVFTGKREKPEQIFDLRLQLRTNEIDAVTKDGIHFIVRVFTAFRSDPATWDKDTYAKMLEMNPFLKDADKPSHTAGSFPFSHRRIQATISTTSTKTTGHENPTLWDQWVLDMVNEETRKVVSQKTLDEFWRPLHDKKNANAMSGIAEEIKDRLVPMMRSKGILLVVSRIVNFKFPLNGEDKMAEIAKQQIAIWGADWELKRAKILAEAQAESERIQLEARAYAEALLLNSIADGLQKVQGIDSHLPRYVIAMRFLSSLQDYQSDEKNTEKAQSYFKNWQEQLFPDQDKDK